MDRLNWLDSAGGHIAVALFIFLVGVMMVAYGVSKGEEVIVGSLASLWTSLQTNIKGVKE